MIMDNDKLICLVKQNEVLYNKQNPFFKFSDKKREVWQKIAEKMDVSEKACKQRWTSLCDRYSLECHRMKNEKGYKPSWIFMELMEFLRPHITPGPDNQYYKERECQYGMPVRPNDDAINEGYPRSAESQKSTLNETLIEMHNNPFLPQNPTIHETLLEIIQENRRKKFKEENPSVSAFGDMIVATICSMHPRNQIKAMKKATNIIMKIKLEED